MTQSILPNVLPTTTIRPGLLVSLSARITGGVSYNKIDLEPTHLAVEVGENATKARWETTRTIADADEYERAQKTRSKARSLVARACCDSPLGLLCPTGRETDLLAAIAEARREINDFNQDARQSRIDLYVLIGRVSDSDVEAVRAITGEVRGLLDAMDAGIKAADPEAVREAASRARALSGMLSDDVQAKVGKAIEEVRAVARDLVRATTAGETAASVLDQAKLERLKAARFAVLDIDGTQGVGEVVIAAVAAPAAPAIDLMPADVPQQPIAAPQPVAIDL